MAQQGIVWNPTVGKGSSDFRRNHPGTQRKPPCQDGTRAHHFTIDKMEGDTSMGLCKRCGLRWKFANYPYGTEVGSMSILDVEKDCEPS